MKTTILILCVFNMVAPVIIKVIGLDYDWTISAVMGWATSIIFLNKYEGKKNENS